MTTEDIKHFILQVTDKEYHMIKKLIDEYNRLLRKRRENYIIKERRYKDKAKEYAYPKVIEERIIKKLEIPPI